MPDTVDSVRIRSDVATVAARKTSQTNEIRVLLLTARFIGGGYLCYLILLQARIRAEAHYLAAWWTPLALLAVFLPPVLLLAFSFRGGAGLIKLTAVLVPPLFMLATLSWPLAWCGHRLSDSPWLSSMAGLPAITAALVMRPRWAVGWLFVVVTSVQILSQTRVPETNIAFIADWLFEWGFCLIYVACIGAVMHTVRLLDATHEEASAAAADAEILHKYESDRAGITDLLHDGVIFALTMAAKGLHDDGLRAHASETIAELERDVNLIGAEVSNALCDLDTVVDRVRTAVTRIDSAAVVLAPDTDEHGSPRFDWQVVNAVCLSVGEAVRNSLRHAGPNAHRTVSVAGEPGSLLVAVKDDGCGFDPAMAPIGIGLQQMQTRMRHLRGGAVDISSVPGRGTHVCLTWTDPHDITADEPSDIRTMMGMKSRWAWLVAAFFIVGSAALAMGTQTLVHNMMIWPTIVALLVIAAATAGILCPQGDPLPLPITLLIAAGGIIACSMVLLIPPYVMNMHELWFVNAYTPICTFLCFRGRISFAWITLTATIALAGVWSSFAVRTPEYGIDFTLINYGPLAMATFLTLTIRPATRRIFELRNTTIRAHAVAEVAAAAIDERNAELHELARRARPLLERITDVTPFTADDTQRCATLGEELRDHLRAMGLVHPLVDPSSQAARQRGVKVVMLDDKGMNDIDEAVRHRVLRQIAHELDRTHSGSIAVRIVPPGRNRIATIVAHTDASVRRMEFDLTGASVVNSTRDSMLVAR